MTALVGVPLKVLVLVGTNACRPLLFQPLTRWSLQATNLSTPVTPPLPCLLFPPGHQSLSTPFTPPPLFHPYLLLPHDHQSPSTPLSPEPAIPSQPP